MTHLKTTGYTILNRFIVGLCLMALLLLSTQQLYSQASIVRNRLQMVAMGKIDDVKKELPDLLAEFPDDPGVQFLHASVLEDIAKSLPIYQRIVQEKPNCEWADDAQWRIVHYYTMKRDTSKARFELQTFRKSYPQSELLLTAYDLIRATVGAGKSGVVYTDSKNTSIVPKNDATPAKKTDNTALIPPKVAIKDSTKTTNPNLLVGSNTQPNTNPVMFTLQVGVFKTRKAAETDLADYQAKRMRCSITERKMPDASMRYVVTIGEYKSKQNAEAAIALVKEQCNCTPLIIQKLNQ